MKILGLVIRKKDNYRRDIEVANSDGALTAWKQVHEVFSKVQYQKGKLYIGCTMPMPLTLKQRTETTNVFGCHFLGGKSAIDLRGKDE